MTPIQATAHQPAAAEADRFFHVLSVVRTVAALPGERIYLDAPIERCPVSFTQKPLRTQAQPSFGHIPHFDGENWDCTLLLWLEQHPSIRVVTNGNEGVIEIPV